MKDIYVNDIDKIKDKQLIDVREPYEQRNGMIRGAVSIPLMTLPDNLEKINKGKPVYVVCEAGGRSFNACEYLDSLGYDCANLLGGMSLYEGKTE